MFNIISVEVLSLPGHVSFLNAERQETGKFNILKLNTQTLHWISFTNKISANRKQDEKALVRLK